MAQLTTVFIALAALGFASCASPVSPTPVVRADFSLPTALSGAWHGVSAQIVSGSNGMWNLEDMLLRSDGSVEINEYQGPMRRFVAAWFLDTSNVIVIEGTNACRRTGTVDGNAMNLRCSTGGRVWDLVFTRQ